MTVTQLQKKTVNIMNNLCVCSVTFLASLFWKGLWDEEAASHSSLCSDTYLASSSCFLTEWFCFRPARFPRNQQYEGKKNEKKPFPFQCWCGVLTRCNDTTVTPGGQAGYCMYQLRHLLQCFPECRQIYFHNTFQQHSNSKCFAKNVIALRRSAIMHLKALINKPREHTLQQSKIEQDDYKMQE